MTKARVNADNASADIQGVTAGTGLTGGGTSGTVTLTNDMATAIDAKGDLVVGTGADTYDNLAVGSNGQSLYADSSTSTGLRWQDDTSVGRNKIINGDFGIWQRGTTFTSPASGAYTADRFFITKDGTGNCTISQQSFTAGTAPVSGYESQFFYRISCTSVGSTTTFQTQQRIEDVRTFAGQTITISFWAKKDNNKTIGVFTEQNFGSGGSSPVFITTGRITPSTSWARYSVTLTLASIAGKTIGAGSYLSIYFAMDDTLTTSSVLDIWGVQVEAGSVATPFQTATGTIQGELAACQRYYYRQTSGTTYGTFATGTISSTTGAYCGTTFPVQMRVAPTSFEYSSLRVTDKANFGVAVTSASLSTADTTPNLGMAQYIVASGLTAYRPCFIDSNNISTGYIAFNAEL